MNAPVRHAWTQKQVFSWAETQEKRFEFDGSQPIAMTGGNRDHIRVFGNL
jgi:hypothetical protein